MLQLCDCSKVDSYSIEKQSSLNVAIWQKKKTGKEKMKEKVVEEEFVGHNSSISL